MQFLHNFVTMLREAVVFMSQSSNVKKKLRSLSSTAISAGLHLHGTRHLLMIKGMLPARIPMMSQICLKRKMERWKSRCGLSERRERKKKEDQRRKSQKKEDAGARKGRKVMKSWETQHSSNRRVEK